MQTKKPNSESNVIITPISATNKNVQWSSSDPQIATIDASGRVNALKVGKTIITVTSEADTSISTSCEVVVIIKMTDLNLNKSNLTLDVGEQETLSVIVSPSDATNKNVIWNSTDSQVATVDETGKITALKVGKTIITAYSEENTDFNSSCEVTVIRKVTGVSLNKSILTLSMGGKETLQPIVTPVNATNKQLLWNSDNTEVATVNENGVVLAVKEGKAIITVIVEEDNTLSASCEVTVSDGTFITQMAWYKLELFTTVVEREIILSGVPINENATHIYIYIRQKVNCDV